MAEFTTFDGLRLHYEIHGDGPPVVLLHSFGFDGGIWTEMGVVRALVDAGRCAVVPDARGHGRSESPLGPSHYSADAMARDVCELLDLLAPETADLVTFSMGSFVGLRLIQLEPRIRSVVLGGIGENALVVVEPCADPMPELDEPEARRLLEGVAPYLMGRVGRGVANARALVDVLRGGFRLHDHDFAAVTADVLLLTGTRDSDPDPLAAVIRGARVARVDADHASTMPHPEFVPTIINFLS